LKSDGRAQKKKASSLADLIIWGSDAIAISRLARLPRADYVLWYTVYSAAGVCAHLLDKHHQRGCTCLIHHNGKATHQSGMFETGCVYSGSLNCLTCCAPIINHTGPVRRIRWRGIGRPRGVWFLRPLPTSDHRLHLSLDDKNSRLIADENYLLCRHNGKSTA